MVHELHKLTEQDDKFVPAKWEDFLPGFKEVVDDLAQASELIEMTLICRYRMLDTCIKDLVFLFEAYEPSCWYFESAECIRRLMLTGLLVFFEEGTLKIVTASFIAITFMVIYGALKPFYDESDDKLATFAQLMTFLQLFVAILIVTDALSALPAASIGALMVVLNALVVVYNIVSVLAEACMDTIQDMNLEDVAEVIAYGSAAAAAAAAAKKANSPRKKKKVLDNVTETLHTDFSNQTSSSAR